MNKRKKLARLNRDISRKILDVLAMLEVLSDSEQDCYPANTIIEIAKREIKKLFKNIETSRKILKIIN